MVMNLLEIVLKRWATINFQHSPCFM